MSFDAEFCNLLIWNGLRKSRQVSGPKFLLGSPLKFLQFQRGRQILPQVLLVRITNPTACLPPPERVARLCESCAKTIPYHRRRRPPVDRSPKIKDNSPSRFARADFICSALSHPSTKGDRHVWNRRLCRSSGSCGSSSGRTPSTRISGLRQRRRRCPVAY